LGHFDGGGVAEAAVVPDALAGAAGSQGREQFLTQQVDGLTSETLVSVLKPPPAHPSPSSKKQHFSPNPPCGLSSPLRRHANIHIKSLINFRIGNFSTMGTFQITKAQLISFPGEPIAKCPLNWIELEYLYVDGTPVAGAKYTVKDPHSSFCAMGILDEHGQTHVELPPSVSQVTYIFHDDPDTIQFKKQPQPHGQQVAPGWMDRTRQMLVDSGT
jgi:hypothetical protein